MSVIITPRLLSIDLTMILVTDTTVNGSTGESLSLTVEERKLLAEEWIRVGRKR